VCELVYKDVEELCNRNVDDLGSGAFLLTEYNEILLGYQPGQVVEQCTLRMRTEMAFEILVFFHHSTT